MADLGRLGQGEGRGGPQDAAAHDGDVILRHGARALRSLVLCRHGRKAGRTGLRCEPLAAPALAVAAKADAVVQPALPALPELDRVRAQAEAAPELRAGDALRPAGEAGGHLGDGVLQDLAARDGAALVGGPGAKARPLGAAREVGLGRLARYPLDRALDAHLAVELRPEEDERRVRVLGELSSLAAVVVGEEDEAPLVAPLEQDDARRGAAVAVGGRPSPRPRVDG